MPSPKPSGVWTEYTLDETTTAPVIVRPYPGENSGETLALRSAVEHGHKVAFVRFGETLAEALNRAAEEKAGPSTRPGSKSPATSMLAPAVHA